MKRFLLLLAMVLTATKSFAVNPSSYTNFGGIGVGSVGRGTYTNLTGVALQFQEIPLTSILVGTNGTTALADTAITTGLYVGQATSLTNVACVDFPAETNTPAASINVAVPWNYQSGGQLVLCMHTSSTFTAGAISITADVYNFPLNGLTTTTRTPGTVVQLPVTVATTGVTLTATIASVTFAPGSVASFKLTKTGTYKVEVLKAWFGFRPGAVINGQ